MQNLIQLHPLAVIAIIFLGILFISLIAVAVDRIRFPYNYINEDDKYVYSGNEFYSNVSLTELLIACDKVEFVKRYSVLTITYSDNFTKDFDALDWCQLGKHILANCKGVRIEAHFV